MKQYSKPTVEIVKAEQLVEQIGATANTGVSFIFIQTTG